MTIRLSSPAVSNRGGRARRRHHPLTAGYGAYSRGSAGRAMRGSQTSVERTRVTGPSLTRLIVMWAPNEPDATVAPAWPRQAQNRSTIGRPSSGRAALRKLGRFWPRASANRVNWETTRNWAPTWLESRLNLPSPSLKTRRWRIFLASRSASASVSPSATPSRIRKPCPMAACPPSQRTPASRTRCTTARIPRLLSGSQPAQPAVDAHGLGLGLQEGGREVTHPLQAEAPHPRLVPAVVGVRMVGRRIEGYGPVAHALDHRPGCQSVIDRHSRGQPALADLDEAQLGDGVVLVLHPGACLQALAAVVEEVESGDGVGLVPLQPEEAGCGQMRTLLVAGMPEIFHGEEVPGPRRGQPEAVTAPVAAGAEGMRVRLQLWEVRRIHVVDAIEEHAAHRTGRRQDMEAATASILRSLTL